MAINPVAGRQNFVNPMLSQQATFLESRLKNLQVTQEANNTLQQTYQQQIKDDIKLVFGSFGA